MWMNKESWWAKDILKAQFVLQMYSDEPQGYCPCLYEKEIGKDMLWSVLLQSS